MAQRNYKAFSERWLRRMLLEEASVKSMLERLLTELIKVEAEAKLGTPKGKHSRDSSDLSQFFGHVLIFYLNIFYTLIFLISFQKY